MRVERVSGLDELGARAAAALIEVCRERQAAGAVPCLVLTGGRAGAQLLISVRDHAARDTVDWSRVRLLWGDERWVAAGHADRNDLLADESLLASVGADPSLVHRVPASDSGLSLDEAAAAYAEIVAGLDRIDLAVNGVGEDGHIASLFPGREDLLRDDPGTPAAFAVRDSPKPPPERVTLSMPVLRSADRVWLLAAGEGKAEAVRGILAQSAGTAGDAAAAATLPAALVTHGRAVGADTAVLWADDAALSLVSGGGAVD